MKRFLIILLLLPVIAFGQWVGGPGEYYNGVLNTITHKAYTLDNGVPTLVTQVSNASQIIGGPHSMGIIDSVGNAWFKGQNNSGVVPCGSATDQPNFVKCMTDSAGHQIDPVIQIVIGGNGNHNISNDFWDVFAVTSSGKLYAAGELEGYVRGDGTAGAAVNTRWVRINIGSGTDTFVTKVQGGYGMLAMTAQGSVYTWGADRDGYINAQGTTTAATTPTKVALPGGKTAIDIASNGLVHAVVLNDGTKAMTGQQNLNDYTGIWPTAMTRIFQDVTSALGLPAAARSVSMNASTTYWLLTTGALFAHGDNSCGTIGNGDMLDWSAYKCCPGPSSGSPVPYNYDNGFHEHMVIHPVEVVPGKLDWTGVSTCPSNSWFVYAYDSKGNFISWGRNKFGPLGNGIIGANPVIGEVGANFPDSWTRPLPTVQNLAAIIAYVQSTSPYCILNPAATHCTSYTETDVTKPVAALSGIINGSLVTWDASASTDNTGIVDFVHTQVSGTALQYKIRTGKKDSVAGVSSGSYTSKIVVKDRAFNADSSTATVCVGCSPTVSAGSNKSITLPTSSTGVTGTATAAAGNGWAALTYLWTKVSGPGATTITGNTTLTPTMSGLQGGIYVFQLRATDVNSNTNTSTDTVTVSGSGNCNCSYYFASSGADGNAGTSGSPFQTLPKLNSLAADTTASFYLNRGDVFTGAITNFSGKTLDAYGTGARPVVSGFVTLSGWSSLGGGIYSASCLGCRVTDNILTMDGIQQPLARYPNTGYLTYESFSGTTSITDNQLTGSPNWIGGYVAIRNNQYTLSTNLITNHSGTTITYTSASSLPATNNFGYFITNDSLALDTLGEWWVSSGPQKIKMYFGAATPSSYTIKTTTADTLLGLADGLKGVTINNIDFEGAGIYGVYIGQDTNTVIQNCTFNWMGSTAILDNKGQYSRLINNNIRNANDNGIFTAGTADHTYSGYDTVAQCGMMPGQGRMWQTHNYMGIATTSHRSIVEYCRVDTTGYNNYYCYNYDRISHNWGNASCNWIQDGAAIYSLGYTDTTETKHIDSNVLVHGIGAVAGTNAANKFVNGVYVDQNNANVFVGGNTVWDMPNGGIFIHNTRRSSITDNTVYGCTYQILFQGDTWTYPINNMTVKRNKLGVSGPNQYMYRFDQFNGLRFNNSFGSIDSNYYGYYTNTTIGFMNSITNQTYKQWQDSTAETHGRILAAPLLFQVNGTSVPVAVGLSNTYVDAINNAVYTSATIPAFGSLLLFQGNYFRIRKNYKNKFQ